MLKYAAAAKGGKNVASQGGARVAKSVSRPGAGRNPLSAASGAGYEGGRSSYIRMNGSGYQPGLRGKASSGRAAPPKYFKPNLPPARRVADLRRRPRTTDEQLSSLL